MTPDRRETLRKALGAEPVERAREVARQVAEEEVKPPEMAMTQAEMMAIQLVTMLASAMASLAQAYGQRVPGATREEMKDTISDLRVLICLLVGGEGPEPRDEEPESEEEEE